MIKPVVDHKPHVIIKQAHVVDPANGIDGVLDIELKEMEIVRWGKQLDHPQAEIIQAKGLVLMPGFLDLHVHFRDPGFEHKETIQSGVQAAIYGGFVGCVTMPNTKPACDNSQIVKYQIERGEQFGFNIFPAGTLTQGREGKKISEMAEMKASGAVAVSDDGTWVQDSGVARRAYEYAATYDLLIMSHAEDCCLSMHGSMNEGVVSTKLGLRAVPNAAEDVATARDVEIARLTGCRLHICHVSTRQAVETVRRAKADGIKVTCEVTPHHLALTDESFMDYDTNFKMNPPLRTEADRQAVIRGLEDGTIDAVATDHAPHAAEEKAQDVESAPPGVIGLESAFGVVMTELYHGRKWKLADIVKILSLKPGEIIGNSQLGRLVTGVPANFVLADPCHTWQFDESHIHSKSKNSCFLGKKLKGKVLHTFVNGTHYDLNGGK
ncbi:MAG: hypothetical protein A2Z83_02610 [Omnitrophica bacterium GWA2_52_8]|nr:MAG: hypothetical protein A2Z83_02610 [Omnitrophica bacterium GWA2_52_8]